MRRLRVQEFYQRQLECQPVGRQALINAYHNGLGRLSQSTFTDFLSEDRMARLDNDGHPEAQSEPHVGSNRPERQR
jgi:hypothetical protein